MRGPHNKRFEAHSPIVMEFAFPPGGGQTPRQLRLRAQAVVIKKVDALFLKGSIARGTADKYADIDYYCLIQNNSMQTFLDKRKEIVSSIGKIIYLEEVNFGNPQLVVIYENEVHLDFYLISEMPSSGTDAIQVIHDPKGIATSYKRVNLSISNSDIIEYINETLYYIYELEIASDRKDLIWHHRIKSHIISYLAMLMDIKNCSEQPVQIPVKTATHSG
jgi:tRNA/tmRNA/rRNA uracil-C5-methylase (TrmA/RlmC/RlmD family)